MKKHKFLFLVLAFSFIACQSIDKEMITEEEVKENPYLGEWYSVERIIPFGAVLKIDTNNSFTYEGGACLYHFNSKGGWTLSGDTLILNSFEPEECCYLNEFGLVGGIIILDSNGVNIHSRPISIKGCEPIDTKEYIIFNHEKLVIEDSVLTHIQKPDNMYISDKNNFTRTKR